MDKLAYLEGFIEQCVEFDIDPEEVLKTAATIEDTLERVGGGVRGSIGGALVGGTIGAAAPLVAATAFLLKHPKLRKMISVKDLAKAMGSSGLLGAGTGGAAGGLLGSIGEDIRDIEEDSPSKSHLQAGLRGAGRGAVVGGSIGAAAGALRPLLELAALKSQGGRVKGMRASDVLKRIGSGAAIGGTTGLIGGAGIGGSIGASIGKKASSDRSMAGSGAKGTRTPPRSAVKVNPVGGGLGAGTSTYKIADLIKRVVGNAKQIPAKRTTPITGRKV